MKGSMENKPSTDTTSRIEHLKAQVAALADEVRNERKLREDAEDDLDSERSKVIDAEHYLGVFVGDIFNICEAMSACNPKKPWSRVRVDDRDEALKMLHAIVDEMEANVGKH